MVCAVLEASNEWTHSTRASERKRKYKFIKCEKLLLSFAHENESLSVGRAPRFVLSGPNENSRIKKKNGNRSVCHMQLLFGVVFELAPACLATTHHFRYFEWTALFCRCPIYVLCTHMALNVRPIVVGWLLLLGSFFLLLFIIILCANKVCRILVCWAPAALCTVSNAQCTSN